ncbi:MAG: ABC transporter permease [Lachnospiraceae bacterium]|jgi:putative ABC transport system permease protein|nr:ABC transporter permease [Lachnospiraceae bacterium]
MNVFTKTTIKTLKKNKTRTLVTIIGIVLATAMLTAVTTFISSLQSYMIRAVIAEKGDWHGNIYELSQDQIHEIEEDDRVEHSAAIQELGYALLPGATEDSYLERRAPYLFVMGMDEKAKETLPVYLRMGRMPQNEGELAVSSMAISSGKADIELGDTLTLEIGKRIMKGEEAEELFLYNPLIMTSEEGSDTPTGVGEELSPQMVRTYQIVGIIDTPRFLDSNSVSYAAITAADREPEEGSRFACFYKCGKASDVYDVAEDHMAGDTYATYNSELLRYQGTSRNRPFMRMLYGLAAVLILLIMTGGISLAHNSFAISVSDRTKQFGLLASTGATPRQLRGMVLREALLVSAVGIPLGIVSGIAGSGITLHFTGSSFFYLYDSIEPMHLHVSWSAVAIAAITALITVLISAFIPSWRAARVSPMEAIRQAGDIKVPKRVARKGRLSYRFFGLEGMIAGKHFSRSKKQYRTTIFSLFISIVLFISASSFSSYVKSSITVVNGEEQIDVSLYMEEESEGEIEKVRELVRSMERVDRMISIANVNMDLALDPNLLTEDYRKLLDLEYVPDEDGWGPRYLEDGQIVLYDCSILVMEDEEYEAYVEELGLPAEEYTGTKAKAVALNQLKGYMPEQQRYRLYDIMKAPGDELEMLVTDYEAFYEAERETGEEPDREAFQTGISVTVGAFADHAPMNLYGEWGGGFSVILSESMFTQLIGEGNPYLTNTQVYIQTKDHAEVAERLEALSVEGDYDSYFFVIDQAQSRQTHRSLLVTVDVFAYGFIALISLIAVANVFNTISNGVLLRRKEFAVLSSVGMTPKGLRRMLHYECVLYGCKALLYGLPVSLLVTWEIYRVVERSMDTGFYVPVSSILIAVCSVFLVVFATMMYTRGRMKGENVIDSIREESL